MSGPKKSNCEMDSKKKTGSDSLADRLKNSLSIDKEKSDEKPNLGSPVSTLRTGFSSSATATTSTTARSSSSSSASVSGPRKSGEFSGKASAKSSPKGSGQKPNRPPNISGGGRGSVKTSPARNVLPPCGNLFPSGVVMTTGMATKPVCTELNPGMATEYYGYGSIIRGDPPLKSDGSAGISSKRSGGVTGSKNELEELKIRGKEYYKKGNFLEALNLYDKAIAINRDDATLRCDRAAALIGLKRLPDAVKECEEAIRLSPSYARPHQRLGSLLLSFGQVESARRHFFSLGHKPDQAEFQKLQAVEKHIRKCSDARSLGDWTAMLNEAEAAAASGAEASPQLFACRAEAYLKLHLLRDADMWIHRAQKSEPSGSTCMSKLFGMLSEAYVFLVEAHIETAHRRWIYHLPVEIKEVPRGLIMNICRYDNAREAMERAAYVDLQSAEITASLRKMRLVGRARCRGNELFKAARYSEACSAYGEGLLHDSSSSVLYCNRAACWYKLEKWENCLNDCNHALRIQPYYTKALHRKAASNAKLERWAEAVKNYEALRREHPSDKEIAESLFNAQVGLKKSRGEDVSNMKFGGKVELISDIKKFRAAISSSGAYVIYFKAASNQQCEEISLFVNTLSSEFPSVSFLKVDIEQSPAIGALEKITTVPTFKIYKDGSRVMEMVSPSQDILQSAVRHYST